MRTRGSALVIPLLAVLACSTEEGSEGGAWVPDTNASSTGTDSAPGETRGEGPGPGGPGESGSEETGEEPTPELAEVGHERELRGAWIATVYNINWPSSQSLTVAAMQDELLGLLDVAIAHNLNVLVVQIRPEADAMYASDLEPWSRYLTGMQGSNPGFDPLDFLIEHAHESGIEVHAWFNPYRAAANASAPIVQPHVSLAYPQHAHVYGNLLWMDPGAEPVQEHTVDVVLDVVDRYDIDGVHFDDYFYPYPNGTPFPDDATYGAYVSGGGTMARDDWRRDNVNRLVELLHDEIESADPSVRFGISPFGIYRPGMPPGITGLDQYAEIYADPVKWIQEGWVDYLAPQLYWPTTQTAQAYEPLIEWWVSIAPEGRNVFTGNFLSQLGSSSAWTVDEILTQVELSREYQLDSPGNIFYHIAPLVSDQLGVGTALVDELYPHPVLTPPMWERAQDEVAHPQVTVIGDAVELAPRDETPLRAWVVYRDEGGMFVLDRIVAVSETLVELGPGRWAISAAARSSVESLGVVVELHG
jgi:uncharacterized lipoprotein YddW (UPF0748 family)